MIGEAISESLWLLLLVQGTACVTAGLAASYLLRHRPARAHQALLTALLASLLMPGLYLSARHFGLGVFAAPDAVSCSTPALGGVSSPAEGGWATSAALPATEIADELTPLGFRPVVEAPALKAARTRVSRALTAAVCWIATSMLLSMRLILRFLLGLRVLKTARPLKSECLHHALEAARAKLGVDRPVQMRCSEKVRSPVIWCWARTPVLLVHEQAGQEADSVDWVGVFCHEFAHLRRRDHSSGLFAEVLTALFPWHPLLWWARNRLVRLSEQACDDWVLAAGQTGVDYAESLLDLAPQRQMAILPTVAGKEKAMKERIRRIIKDGCGNPTVGLRWAAAVSVLAGLAVVGVAFAQRRPMVREPGETRRPELREEFAAPRPGLIGRRNVLMRLREQLRNQARETEDVLRERGDEMGEESRVLRAELETLHQQIQIVEQQLRALEGGPRPPGRAEAGPRAREQAAPRELLSERLQDLRARGREIQRNLQEHPDMEPDRANALREELARVREQTGAMERELQELERRRERPESESPEIGRARGRVAAPDAPDPERLRAEMRRAEQELRERQERGEGEGPEVNELRERLETMGREMAELQRARAEIERVRAMEQRERMGAEGRRIREAAEQRETLARRQRELQGRLRDIQGVLEQRPDRQDEEARALRQERDRVRDEMAATERELENAQRARALFERELRAREPNRREEGPQRLERIIREPGAGARRPTDPALERQVDELRNQMNELREQMQQMHKLLEESLQRGPAGQTQDFIIRQ